MAKIKFDEEELAAATGGADLKAVVAAAPKQFKDIMIKKISVEIYDKLKENGHTFGGYAKVAVQEKMKRDGLL